MISVVGLERSRGEVVGRRNPERWGMDRPKFGDTCLEHRATPIDDLERKMDDELGRPRNGDGDGRRESDESRYT